MLLTTIVLWALNLTVTKTILEHGLQPLAYSTVRYGLAALVFAGMTLAAERSLRIAGRDRRWAAAAVAVIVVNQIAFVYALDKTSATVVGIVLGATPMFAALLGLALGTEHPSGRFWSGATVSFAGVALVAVGAGGELSGDLGGVLLGVVTAATWAAYSVAITPLMGTYSPSRVSAVVLGLGWVGIAFAGAPQTASQDWSLGPEVWALLVFATLGPLVLTNVLWFRSLHRIGPAKATLAANLQPFVGAVIAYVLLSERMTAAQWLGGACIAAGIVLARRRRPAPPG